MIPVSLLIWLILEIGGYLNIFYSIKNLCIF